VLSGQGAPITADKIKAIITAAGLTPNGSLIKKFAKTFATRNIKDFIGVVGGSNEGGAHESKKEKEK
jgi:ribosomal protein L12E/L44/L45/RPP1/RPP2